MAACGHLLLLYLVFVFVVDVIVVAVIVVVVAGFDVAVVILSFWNVVEGCVLFCLVFFITTVYPLFACFGGSGSFQILF